MHWLTPVLVEDPENIWRSSPTNQGLMFSRNYPAPPPYNLFVLAPFAPPTPSRAWEALHADRFTSVYGVIELFSPQGIPPQTFNFLAYSQKYNRIDTPEDPPYPHTDHAGAFFQFQRRYAAQLVGFSNPYPDYCDDPWLEEVRQRTKPEWAIIPLRQTPVFVRGQQFNLFFNQPRSPVLDPEPDAVFRKPDVGMLTPFARPVILISMPNLIGMYWRDAVNLVTGLSLIVTNLEAQDSTYPILPLPAGTVFFQQPKPGTLIPVSGPVVIIYSTGLMNLPQVGDSVANPVNVVIGPNTLN
jgi:hypothetical protein